jgi:hypothetical protein
MPIDHISVSVPASKYDEMAAFYLQALAPLRYVEMMRFPGVVGLGADGVPDFWIMVRETAAGGDTHFAFSSKGLPILFSPPPQSIARRRSLV